MRNLINGFYRRKLKALPQNAVDLTIRDHSLSPAEAGKRYRLAILVDKSGWAFHSRGEMIMEAVKDKWDSELFILDDNPVIDPLEFDVLYNFNHTPSHYDKAFSGRLVKGLYSYYHHSRTIPWRYVYRLARHASVLVVSNKRQREELRPVFTNTFEMPGFVDTNTFFLENQRHGNDIIAAWSGNPDRKLAGERVKRYYEVVQPACRESGVGLMTGRDLSRDQLRKMYNSSDVVLVASRTEGIPNCFLEAGACGRTVIATSVGVIPQIVEDGVDGFLIDPYLPDKETIKLMASRLTWCRAHPEETRAMGLQLREKILRTYSPEAAGRAYIDLLEIFYRHRRPETVNA